MLFQFKSFFVDVIFLKQSVRNAGLKFVRNDIKCVDPKILIKRPK